MKFPKLSVLIVTYNHEKFITQAIKSVLMQKTNFDFEIIIGDDCSEDRTEDICLKYCQRYPNKIKLLISEKNLGRHENLKKVYKACQGEYIAQLDGDDYWTDPYKLQKQIDFLDVNPDFSICFHNANVKFEDKSSKDYLLNSKGSFQCLEKDTLTMDDLVYKDWFIATSSRVFRNHLIKNFPKWFNETYSEDYTLELLLAQHGKLKFIDEVMCVYRIHPKSISSILRGTLTHNDKAINDTKLYLKYFDSKYKLLFKYRIARLYLERAKIYKTNKNLLRGISSFIVFSILLLRCMFSKYLFNYIF